MINSYLFFGYSINGDFMIESYSVKVIGGKKVLFLNLNYQYEFARGLGSKHVDTDLIAVIKNYIKQMRIDFKFGKVMLMVSGICVATLLFQPVIIDNNMEVFYNNSVSSVTENLSDEVHKNVQSIPYLVVPLEEDTFVQNDYDANVQEVIVPEEIPSHFISHQPVLDDEQMDIPQVPVVQEKPIIQQSPLVQENENVLNSTVKEEVKEESLETSIDEVEAKTYVTLHRSNGLIEHIELEEYLVGVVAAEMPASFHIEALKAQAIVARTYTLKRISLNQPLTDTVATQVYLDIAGMRKEWGSDFEIYYNKIKEAVYSTKDQVITYQGNYIDAVYHSTSNGYTEDASMVWGNSIPYLVSVESKWDVGTIFYHKTVTKDSLFILQTLGIDLQKNPFVQILERDSSNRVVSVQVGEQVYSGTQFRSLLGLQSTDFDISLENNSLVISTRGWGHGVGMSQFGANGMAKDGYLAKDIITYYYCGVTVS